MIDVHAHLCYKDYGADINSVVERSKDELAAVIVSSAPGSQVALEVALAEPKAFGGYLFQRHWLVIEIVSLLLLIALVGTLYLGRKKPEEDI